LQRAYYHSTRALGAVVCVLGLVMVVTTLARGGGPLAMGVIVGAGLAAFGAGRVYLAGGR
jgi:hypothetical protein